MDFPAEKFVGKVVQRIENSADCAEGLHITFTDGTWIDVGFYAERAGEINYFSLPLPKMACVCGHPEGRHLHTNLGNVTTCYDCGCPTYRELS